ncbi:MAG: PIN domain-containing protein [Gemmataceae bacterium]
MIFLLDANACIRYLRDPKSRVRQELSSRPPSAIRLSSVVMSELYRGALRSKNPPVERAKVDAFAVPYTIQPFHAAESFTHAEIRVDLERRGLAIGPYDMLIAAIAKANGFTLVTHNTVEFSRIPNLLLVGWETP